MYIGAAWADEGLQEEGAHSDKATSSSTGPLAMVMLPLAPQPRALARCWDSALFPEIAFKVVFKKNTMRHHELPGCPCHKGFHQLFPMTSPFGTSTGVFVLSW